MTCRHVIRDCSKLYRYYRALKSIVEYFLDFPCLYFFFTHLFVTSQLAILPVPKHPLFFTGIALCRTYIHNPPAFLSNLTIHKHPRLFGDECSQGMSAFCGTNALFKWYTAIGTCQPSKYIVRPRPTAATKIHPSLSYRILILSLRDRKEENSCLFILLEYDILD